MKKWYHQVVFFLSYTRRSDLACQIALEAVQTVVMEENGRKEIDIKRYAKVEKVDAHFD